MCISNIMTREGVLLFSTRFTIKAKKVLASKTRLIIVLYVDGCSKRCLHVGIMREIEIECSFNLPNPLEYGAFYTIAYFNCV